MKLTPRAVIFFAVALCFIALGSLGIYQGIKHPAPQAMSVSQLAKTKPSRGWFRVTGGTLDIQNAIWMVDGETEIEDVLRDDMYVPLLIKCPYDKEGYTIDPEKPERVMVLIQVSDPKLRKMIVEFYRVGESKNSEKEYDKFYRKHGSSLWPQLNVEGVIKYGFDFDSETRKNIQDTHGTMAPDFIVIRQNVRPPGIWAFFILFGGGFFAAIGGLAAMRSAYKTKR